MAKESKKVQGKKRFAIIPVIIVAGVALVLLTAGGFAFGASQESHDSFCASCHTMPETSFVARSTGASPTDLASFHTTKSTLCIDCHSGVGIPGRIQAEMLGASNAAKWFTGTAVQPAVLSSPIGDQSCLKCHQNVVVRGFSPIESISLSSFNGGERTGRKNHFHEFLTRWQAVSPTAGTCTSCHSGHAADTSPQAGFMNTQNVQATCNACHQVLRKGDDGG